MGCAVALSIGLQGTGTAPHVPDCPIHGHQIHLIPTHQSAGVLHRSGGVTDTPRRAIAWFRRDLRLTDNRMLEVATRDAERVWPVFVADPALLQPHGGAPARVAWFGANLRALDERLRESGSGLTVLRGRPDEVLPGLAKEIGAEQIYTGADEDPVAIARDDRVASHLDLRLVDDQRIVAPSEMPATAARVHESCPVLTNAVTAVTRRRVSRQGHSSTLVGSGEAAHLPANARQAGI